MPSKGQPKGKTPARNSGKAKTNRGAKAPSRAPAKPATTHANAKAQAHANAKAQAHANAKAKAPPQGKTKAPAKVKAKAPAKAKAQSLPTVRGRAQASTARRGAPLRPALAGRTLAITGTPGTGKTTLAALAAKQLGCHVVDVKAWAHEVGAVVGRDDEDDADVIDVELLVEAMQSQPRKAKLSTTIYEGHLSHLLPVDFVWVIRADPDLLRTRLMARGYPPAKVRENCEAEALDLILQEALDADLDWPAPRVIQRDATRRNPQDLLREFLKATRQAASPADLEAVDWMDRLGMDIDQPS